MSEGQSNDIRSRLEKLAKVSRDLDRHTKLAKTASHPIQAQQLRKRMDELGAEQSDLMEGLVNQHPNPQTKQQFEKLSEDIDKLKVEIRGCEDKEALEQLEAQIDQTVSKWVHQFQIIVSELSGIEPPNKPVFD